MALTNEDARIVLGMVARGDSRHDIAAWFGENQARVTEVEKGSHGSLTAMPANQLPPKGAPGPKGRRLLAAVQRAVADLQAGNSTEALDKLEKAVARFNQNEA